MRLGVCGCVGVGVCVCVKSQIPATIARKLTKIRKIFFCPIAENKFAQIEISILSLWPFGNSAGPKTQKKNEKFNSLHFRPFALWLFYVRFIAFF
jgi:hypothetical protein